MSTNAIIIPSKGRPDCITARYLLEVGYPGDIVILLGDDDETAGAYVENFGSNMVCVFDKEEATRLTDSMDAYGDSKPSGVAPARNQVAETAYCRGLQRCWVFDDDYDCIVKYDGAPDYGHHEIRSGSELFEELDKIETFGADCDLPVVGFDTRGWRADWSVYSNYVFNGFNIDVRPERFVKFRGRLFEDAVHSLDMARTGVSDFCFRHLQCHPWSVSYAWNETKTKQLEGGLRDTYEVLSKNNLADGNYAARLPHFQYTLMVAPISTYGVFGNGSFRQTYKNDPHVKILSGKWGRE